MALAPDIVTAVARRLAEHVGLELDAPAYVDLIGAARGSAELDELLECVRVGETRLFRHKQQIAVLEDVVVPTLRHRRELRVWSAGCAAGEEAYTLAALLMRRLPDTLLSILATDVSGEALELARAASYPATAIAHVPEAYREAFVVDGDRLRVRPEVARLVRFERANLIDSAPEGGFDIVWCRNVLIYFTAEAKKRAIDHLVKATVMGGVVFVGYSESMRDVAELEPVRAGEAVYYVRAESPGSEAEALGSLTRGRRVPLRTPPLGVPAAVPAVRSEPVNQWREPTNPRIVAYGVYQVTGSPDPGTLTAELSSRLGAEHLRLVVDLDGAELLADELAPVLRRAMAAGRAAGVELELRATKPGCKRWLARHKLEAP